MFKKLFTIPVTDTDLQRHGQVIITIALFCMGIILLTLPVILIVPDPLPSLATNGIALLLVGIEIVLARVGQVKFASWLIVISGSPAILLPILIRREVDLNLVYLIIPLIIAGVVLRPREIWVVLAFTLILVGLIWVVLTPAARANAATASTVVSAITLIVIVGLVSFLGAFISGRAFAASTQARQEAEASAHQFEHLNTTLEAQVGERTAELRSTLSTVEARAAEQQSLLNELTEQRDQIREMSMPVLPVDQHTLVLPLVGALDSQRLLQLQEHALAAVERSGARTLLLDVTGVQVIDSQVAQGLIRTVQAVRLLGAEPVLIGVRPEVAQTLVALGIDLTGLRTASDLQGALHRNRH